MLDAQSRTQAYADWLAQRPPPAEIMAGLHAGTFSRLRLDEARAMPDDPGLSYGGYGEDRAIYDSPVFTGDGEPRTVHLGLDIFAPAGTEVFAPLAGRVHSFRDNANPLDYGPTVILEHQPVPSLVFYTLYGHLNRDSLEGLERGKPIRAGERVGRLGEKSENGGWPPHLHVQVMLDLMGYDGDFPGVARRSERRRWLDNCPDPGPLLGMTA